MKSLLQHVRSTFNRPRDTFSDKVHIKLLRGVVTGHLHAINQSTFFAALAQLDALSSNSFFYY